MLQNIDSKIFREMMVSGSRLLGNHREAVDALNVFPVPDGDTGTNMSLTMQAALKELESIPEDGTIKELADAMRRGSLKGARGNSGVILSQILKGFCEVVINSNELTTRVFSDALKKGAEIAYGAVTKPKEGTILTVIRMTAEFSTTVSAKHSDFLKYMQLILDRADEILKSTPDMLPVLKKAGVVDSGGKGLIYVLRGFYKAMSGIEVPILDAADRPKEESVPIADFHDLEDIKFAYCTEFFITNINPKTTEADIDRLRDTLCDIGDSTIVIGDLYLVKVHVHTNRPGEALSRALRIGEVDKVKIENMLQQNRELRDKQKREKKELGIISVSSGAGLEAIFRDYGVDFVVDGGQTKNPSVNDFLDAINIVNAESILILPNNKNITMAAENSKELAGKKVLVVSTANISEGISALMAFLPDASIEENAENMLAAAKRVKSGQVTYSVKNTNIDGFKLKIGDIIGMSKNNIVSKNRDVYEVLKETVERIADLSAEVVTLFFGNGLTYEEADDHVNRLRQAMPRLEFNSVNGGQPHYYYYISVE